MSTPLGSHKGVWFNCPSRMIMPHFFLIIANKMNKLLREPYNNKQCKNCKTVFFSLSPL